MNIGSRSRMAQAWHRDFNQYAGDIYPEQYPFARCEELVEKGTEIMRLSKAKESHILVHYYLPPEFHEIADKLGDSLALSKYAQEAGAKRVDFQAVYFMGATAKIITGDNTRVFVSDASKALGCSLVFGTNYDWVENWKRENPGGLLITYINSSLYLKAISDFVSTSRNTDRIIAYAAKQSPGKKILVLPDKYLGLVMKSRALALLAQEGIKIDPELIEVYQEPFGGYNACCYVHEQLGHDAVEVAMVENPEAELMIHPECGCASSCMYKLQQGIIPQDKAYFLSTEQMIHRAKASTAQTFIVATEAGHLYSLRKQVPHKKFIPVSTNAQCKFMKANTFDKLLASLRDDRLELVMCDTDCRQCVDPRNPFENQRVIHIPRHLAIKAKQGIDRMLAIQ